MAQVFLSYDRADGPRAKALAQALERAGHFVWWDLHIKGGAEYGKVIEQKLAEADAVIVLWSGASVDSAWVRDEAAAGRDRGRLVPTLLEPVIPPMGFRQYQNLDFSGWKGRGRPQQFSDLVDAIENLAIGSTRDLPASTPTKPSPRSNSHKTSTLTRWLIGAVVLIGLVALSIFLADARRSDDPATVAVEPADASPKARALADNLLVQLGGLQEAKADALQLLAGDSDAEADLTFKIADTTTGGDPRASLTLVDNQGSSLLWSREFVQPGGNQADLRQQLAFSAARVLSCATEALGPDHPALKLTTLKLYLGGCADLSNLLAEDPRAVIGTFRAVTEQAPSFAGGWAKLLVAEREAFRATGFTDKALRQELRTHIRKARQINPTMAETYLAEEWMQSPRPILGWMKYGEEALAKNPNHAEALAMHSLGLTHVGRMREAVEHARRAVVIEPLSPSHRQDLINALMESGAIEQARNELRDAERLWPGATNILQARALLAYRHGDPREAMRLGQSGRLGYSLTASQESFLKARMHPSPANVDRALGRIRNDFLRGTGGFNSYTRALAAFGRNDELMNALLSVNPGAAPAAVVALYHPSFAAVRSAPRFMRVADRLGLVDYWRQSGKWPDFCSEPDLPYDCKAEAAKLS